MSRGDPESVSDALRRSDELEREPAGAPDAGGDANEGGAQAEQQPSSAPPAPSIGVSDRAAMMGMTGSGKSQLCAHLFAIYGGQRVLIDVNDAYELGPDATDDEHGYCKAERLSELDWSKRTVHVVPRNQSEGFYNDLYAAIWDRGNLLAWLDESYGPTSANKAPRWLRTTVTQGRKRKILHLAAMQEPFNVLPVLYSQAEHAFVFRLAGRRADLNALTARLGLGIDELAGELERLPQYGYLRHSLGARTIYRMPPLPTSVVEHAQRHVVIPPP